MMIAYERVAPLLPTGRVHALVHVGVDVGVLAFPNGDVCVDKWDSVDCIVGLK